MTASIYLHQSKQGVILKGHPWVFPKAIAKHTGRLVTGDLVHVFTHEGEPIGVGVYNEHSLYRVRMLAYAFEAQGDMSLQAWVDVRLQQALHLRKQLGLPNELTNAYRFLNSEGDGLSGLTIDCFNQTCVVSSSAYWVEKHQDRIKESIQTILPHHEIIWLPQNKALLQDGWTCKDESVVTGTQCVSEAGILFQVDFGNTQKTGLFLDQRENHQRIGQLAKGKNVLDLYTYTGGFALHAAKAGALSVTAVDSSAQAIHLAKKNASSNDIESIHFIEDDARHYLEKAGDYDLIILDPPKLVPSQKHIQRAKNYYRYLHREVFKKMKPGSLILSCNCSSAMSSQAFTDLVSAQAFAVGRIARILGVFGPSSCHPTLAAFPEGHYLTAVLMAVI